MIELLIEAFSMSALTPDKVCLIDHFSAAFSHKSGFSQGHSPFTMPNYENNFDQEKMRQMYEKTRSRKSPGPTSLQADNPVINAKAKGSHHAGPFLFLGLPRVCMVIVLLRTELTLVDLSCQNTLL
ncbi:hypothetical protein [Roseinatronobacter sp.]|uniref:hypothetical protein n=1 Tax=Roseinatronobacter sp. TaxID=1945755 RepID=UPI003F6E9379